MQHLHDGTGLFRETIQRSFEIRLFSLLEDSGISERALPSSFSNVLCLQVFLPRHGMVVRRVCSTMTISAIDGFQNVPSFLHQGFHRGFNHVTYYQGVIFVRYS